MRYRQLGRSGLTVSVLGLGCNAFGLSVDEASSTEIVHTAIECGVTLFDAAPNYGSAKGECERFLGTAVVGRRDDVVLSTKVGGFSLREPSNAAGSRRNILRSVEGSLARLGTEFIDLLYLHQPDVDTPIEETLVVMDELVRSGKVRYIASSNLKAWQIVECELIASTAGRSRFIATQNAYSLIDREIELDISEVCVRYGIGVAPYFPLAHGLLSGSYLRGAEPTEGSRIARRPQVLENKQALDDVDALRRFSADHGVTLLEVALGGLAAKPAVSSLIAGATKPDQVRANAEAIDWVPSPEETAELDVIAPPRQYVPLGSRTGHLR